MTDYREIIRLHSLKFSNVSIANSLCCSRNTVSEVLKLAETHSLEWPIPETLSNKACQSQRRKGTASCEVQNRKNRSPGI